MTVIKTLGDIARAAQTHPGFEGEIREFIRRDVSFRHVARTQDSAEDTVENVADLIDRVSSNSAAEIDRVMLELRGVRDLLRREGERVQRAITDYTALNHTTRTSMQIISEGLARWRPEPPRIPQDAS